MNYNILSVTLHYSDVQEIYPESVWYLHWTEVMAQQRGEEERGTTYCSLKLRLHFATFIQNLTKEQMIPIEMLNLFGNRGFIIHITFLSGDCFFLFGNKKICSNWFLSERNKKLLVSNKALTRISINYNPFYSSVDTMTVLQYTKCSNYHYWIYWLYTQQHLQYNAYDTDRQTDNLFSREDTWHATHYAPKIPV